MTGNARLPHAFRGMIDRSLDACWLSSVSVWELGVLNARGRFELDVPLRRWVDRALTILPLNQAALTNEVALRASEITGFRDPADRFIAATALSYDLALMTLDEALVAADWLETVSG